MIRDPNKGYLDSWLWVPKQFINVEGVKTALTFVFMQQNNIVTLSLWKEDEHHLLLPREFWEPAELEFPVVDVRPQKYTKTNLKSRIVLDAITPTETTQQNALDALLANRSGILQLACGKGKSVVALELAVRLSVPTIILVDNTQLLDQWKKLILGDGTRPGVIDMREDELGLIQGPSFDWKKPIVLATYHTLAARADEMPQEVREWFGLVVWDEAHHVAAPTFAKTADLFSGYRLGLTATPTRTDGLHVIYNLHIGPVIYKDLIQELRPKIYFLWTGLSLDQNDAKMMALAHDKNGELHQSKLAGLFGRWRARLDLIILQVRRALAAGRKILVLSNSIDELVNLLAIWNGANTLYTDLPPITEKDVGETVAPENLAPREKASLNRQQRHLIVALKDPLIDPTKRAMLEKRLQNARLRLKAFDVFKKIAAAERKRQKEYLQKLLAMPSNAGLMIRAVPIKERSTMLRAKDVVFAVSKYGREGLDDQALDTVIICEPMSSRNNLQQIMGRILRKKAAKKEPIVVFLEDEIGIFISMCIKLRKHLRDWPIDEGGPYTYEMVGHPNPKRSKAWYKPPTLEY